MRSCLRITSKIALIEARTLLEMVQRQVTPAVIACAGKSAAQLAHLRSVGLDNAALYRYTQRLSKAVSDLFAGVEKLRDDLHALPAEVSEESNRMLRDTILRGYGGPARHLRRSGARS